MQSFNWAVEHSEALREQIVRGSANSVPTDRRWCTTFWSMA
jgi:hypothetical protein